jgi:hypothetical protein
MKDGSVVVDRRGGRDTKTETRPNGYGVVVSYLGVALDAVWTLGVD